MTDIDRINQLRTLCEKANDDHLSHFMLGRELLKGGSYDEAVDILKKCTLLNPEHTASFRFLGDALRKADRRLEAADVYRRGIAVSEETRDYQAGKEMAALLEKLEPADNDPGSTSK